MILRSDRYLMPFLKLALQERMVFLSGPRQCGKTTLAKALMPASKGLYLNYDELDDKKKILNYSFEKDRPFTIFDEIHKYPRWRNMLKGLYDKYGDQMKILVTGSARLDHYRKGGDSLFGRYQHLRLHPFTLAEMGKKPGETELKSLFKFGGFPAPLFKGEERFHRVWSLERQNILLREDLRDLEQVKDIGLLEMLIELLPSKVGSILSIKSLKEDLGVAHQTVDRWLTIFESLYLTYRISPYGPAKVKAVKKEPKIFFWDWSQIKDDGPRFENMVAAHLLKYCHLQQDFHGHKMELRFLRNTEGKEIDFVVLKAGAPEFAIECKTGERDLSPAIKYFCPRLKIPKYYQVHLGKKDTGDEEKGGRVLPFIKLVHELGLP